MSPSSSVSRPRRWWWALLLTLLVLLTGLPREALALDTAKVAPPATSVAALATPRPATPRSVDAPSVDRELDLAPLPEGFETRDAGWIHLAYPHELAHWATPLLDEAIAFRAMAQERFGSSVLQHVHVRLALNPAQMAKLAPVNAPYPNYAVGVAYSRAGLILLTEEPLYPTADHDLRAVLRHELAHVALSDAVGGKHVPLWFNEGVAIHLARENAFARTRTLWMATVSGNLIALRDLDQRFPSDIVGTPLAYAEAADVVRFLLRRDDEERFGLLVRRVARGQPFDRALHDSYGMDLYGLELQWHEDVDSRYSIWPVLLSGSMIWAGAVVLVVVGWRRNKRRMKETLARWGREEAREDARLQLLRELAAERARAAAAAAAAAETETPQASLGVQPEQLAPPPSRRDSPVPQVEHDGRWHTLH